MNDEKIKTFIKDNKLILVGFVVGAVLLLLVVNKFFGGSGGDTSANFGQGNNFSGANVNQSKTNTATTTIETNKEKKN